MKTVFTLSIALLWIYLPIRAQDQKVLPTISYQGVLADNNGDPVPNASYQIHFALYYTATGGTPVWQESQTISTSKGIFNVLLGSVDSLNVPFGVQYWLGVSVAGGAEMVPRTQLSPSPYSMRAQSLDDPNGNAIVASGTYVPNYIIPYAEANTIGGGRGNRIQGSELSTISGGKNNTIENAAYYAFIGGGFQNVIDGDDYSTIGGGFQNRNRGQFAVIAGGYKNYISRQAQHSFIGGGLENADSGYTSAIVGGMTNTATGECSFVGAGQSNVASGTNAAIPGGLQNVAAGENSFAAGRRAKANHANTFVWGDGTSGDVTSSASNQWTVRSSGGVRLFTNSTMTSGVQLSAGGNAWSSVSDRKLKESFKVIDTQDILHRLISIPITNWGYKSENPSIRHIGPVAQDFWAAFGLGNDSLRISTIDADGVAFAALQGLYKLVCEKDNVITAHENDIQQLKDRVVTLELLIRSSLHTENLK